MIRPIYIWIFTLIFIIYGLIPCKFPDSTPIIDKKNTLLVTHDECTCCPDFYIEKGEINLPAQYKKYFPNKISEITISGDDTPFNSNLVDLYAQSDFVISGLVIGVDSALGKVQDEECGIKPIFKITKWTPTKYFANFWTFGKTFFIIYFIGSFGLILFSIIKIANYKKN